MNVDETAAAWTKVHDAYLETHLDRLRLLARRRVDWLRSVRWRTDPLDADDREARVDRHLGDTREPGPTPGPPADLEEAIAHADRHLAELDAELVTLGAPPALTMLAHATGLSPVERDAVVIALAPELDHTFRSLYAYLHDDPALRTATPGLVADLTGRWPPDVWQLLDADTPCWRFRLFTVDHGPGGVRTLRLDARMVTFLRGRNLPDERLHDVLAPLPELPLSAAQADIVERLTRWLSDPDRSGEQPVVNLLGAPGQGREAVAAAVGRRLGLVPLRTAMQRLAPDPEPERIRLIDRETILLPAAVYADDPDETIDEPAARTVAFRMLEDLGGLVLLGSRVRRELRRSVVAVDVPPLEAPDRALLWRGALGDATVPADDLDRLVEQFTFGPEAIVRATDEARARAELARGRVGVPPSVADVWAACRTAVGGELGELATRVTPVYSWDDLVLSGHERQLLAAIASQVACRPRVYEQWGFGRVLARGRGVTALFAGPSGTGKTMAAEVIAGHLGLDLHRIDLSSVVSKYIGETEKNLRRVFDAAERGGAVLFFDEADALFGKRTEVSDSHDRHANVEIDYLLQRMEDYTGLAVLATNRKADMDPAFLRRIRFVVTFPFPTADLRRGIWQRVWPRETPLSGLDFDALARMELAGGNIRTIAVNAAFLAADADEPVGMGHIRRAARHEYDKLDRRPAHHELADPVGAHR